jgi:hypothetical protein
MTQIERLKAHIRRRPRDTQALTKLMELVNRPRVSSCLASVADIYKAIYSDDLSDLLTPPRHPFLDMMSKATADPNVPDGRAYAITMTAWK